MGAGRPCACHILGWAEDNHRCKVLSPSAAVGAPDANPLSKKELTETGPLMHSYASE